MTNTGENHPDVVPANRFIDTVDDMTESAIITWFTENPPTSDEVSITLTVNQDSMKTVANPIAQITRVPQHGDTTTEFEVTYTTLDNYDRTALEAKLESESSDVAVETFYTVKSTIEAVTEHILSREHSSKDQTVDTREGQIDRDLISFSTVCELHNLVNTSTEPKTLLREIAGTDIWELVTQWDGSVDSGFELQDAGYLNHDGVTISDIQQERIVDEVRDHLKSLHDDPDAHPKKNFLEMGRGDETSKITIPAGGASPWWEKVADKISTAVSGLAEARRKANNEITMRSVGSGEYVYQSTGDALILAENPQTGGARPPHGQTILDAVEENVGPLPFQYPSHFDPSTEPESISELVYGLFKEEVESMNEDLGLPPESFPVEIAFSTDDRTQRAVELTVQTSLPWKAANVAALKEQTQKNDAVSMSNKDVADMLGIDASTVSRHCDTIERVIKQSEWTVNNLTIDSC